VGDDRTGLRAYGFESPQQAAQILGASGLVDEAAIARWMVREGPGQPRGQHLVFVQMESWSAEPLMYQSPRMDVAGTLAPVMEQAWHFRNFDAAHVGTHPALETLLLGTPITPITTGQYRHIPFDWSIAHVLKRAGYDTLFVTSGHTGWRELNRVLPTQGFDEVVDAASLRAHYGADEGGLWGVWDEYLFRYITERLHDPQRKRPLFVYAMPTTHHPPYEFADELPGAQLPAERLARRPFRRVAHPKPQNLPLRQRTARLVRTSGAARACGCTRLDCGHG
jgi:phosphoglycerol transferase MdoB-like AlkP superfamily enzyme